MGAHAQLAVILDRLAYLERLRAVAVKRWPAGETTDRVRCSVVAADVARQLGAAETAWWRRDLAMALLGAGWRRVNVHGVTMWCGRRRA